MKTNHSNSSGRLLATTFNRGVQIAVTLLPTLAIAYLIGFGGATLRFHHHLLHEIAIVMAVACSAFIGWVALRNYRTSAEEYQFWIALAYFAFATIYSFHGILTRLSDTHLAAFLVFGPASRLGMGLYLMIATLRFRTPPRAGHRLWPHFIGFVVVVTILVVASSSGWVHIPQVRAIEITSNVIFSVTLLTMLVRWQPEYLLRYHQTALFWFIQASAAFLLSKPWTHLWWLAHLVSAAGFIILGYAIMYAHQATGTFSQVFSTAQLQRRLEEYAAQLEIEKQEQAALISRLNQTATELSHTNRDMEQFVYMASHDLKAPLHTISGFADILRRDTEHKLDENASSALGFITDGASRMHALIDGLSTYSQATQKGSPREATNLETLMGEVIADLQGLISATEARVTFGDLPTVEAVPVQIRRVLQNLVNNAIKFRGDEVPVIHVSCMRKEDFWQLSVCDNGIGINREDAQKIFSIFTRLHGAEDYCGSGIGLAVVKRVVEGHGGEVWVESAGAGQGSCFHFTLPHGMTVAKDRTSEETVPTADIKTDVQWHVIA